MFHAIKAYALTAALIVGYTTRIAAIVNDTIVLMVTWYKTAKDCKESKEMGIESPVVDLLVRDGAWFSQSESVERI